MFIKYSTVENTSETAFQLLNICYSSNREDNPETSSLYTHWWCLYYFNSTEYVAFV